MDPAGRWRPARRRPPSARRRRRSATIAATGAGPAHPRAGRAREWRADASGNRQRVDEGVGGAGAEIDEQAPRHRPGRAAAPADGPIHSASAPSQPIRSSRWRTASATARVMRLRRGPPSEQACLQQRAAGLAGTRSPRREARCCLAKPLKCLLRAADCRVRLGLDQSGERQQAAELPARGDGRSLSRSLERPRRVRSLEVDACQAEQGAALLELAISPSRHWAMARP